MAELATRSPAKAVAGTFHLLVLRFSGLLQCYRVNIPPRYDSQGPSSHGRLSHEYPEGKQHSVRATLNPRILLCYDRGKDTYGSLTCGCWPACPATSEPHLLVAKEAWSRRLTSWHRICAGMTLESDRLVVVGGSLLARGK